MGFLALLFAAAFLVIPIIALGLAVNALTRTKSRAPGSLGGQIEALQRSVAQLEQQVRKLTTRLAELQGIAGRADQEPPPPEPAPAPAADAPVPAPDPVPTPVPTERPAPTPSFSTPLPPARSLEERIGARWATWVGVIVLVFAVGFFIREVFARNLISPTIRVAIGLGVGVAMVAGGLALRRRPSLPYLSVGISGGGLAILYLSLYAGYNLYHLFATGTAFGAMVAVTGIGAAIAAFSGQLPLGVLAVTGGLLTPILAHSRHPNENVLIGYLIVLDLMVLAVSRYRPWPVLNRLAWAGSVLLLLPTFSRSPVPDDPATRLLLLTALFGVFLGLPLLRAWLDRVASQPLDLLLVVGNGTLYFAAVYRTLENWRPSLEGVWAFALAGVYLAVGAIHRARVPEDKDTPTVHYCATAVLVALAFPLLLDGPWITVAWAAQAVALIYLAPRFPQRDAALTVAALLFAGAFARAVHHDRFWYPASRRFFNATFGAGIFTVASLALAGHVASRLSDRGGQLRTALWVGASMLTVCLLWTEPSGAWAGVALGILLVLVTIAAEYVDDDAFRVSAVLVASAGFVRLFVADGGLAAAAAGSIVNPYSVARAFLAMATAYAGFRFARRASASDTKLGRSFLGVAWGELLLALSLSWFLHMGRRTAADPELANALKWQMHLGLSALWAVYAGVSLTLGFAWSKAALRYAALALLGLTVAKVFLVDLSKVQTLWRVFSFLVLGLVLLAVSVLYQRRMKA